MTHPLRTIEEVIKEFQDLMMHIRVCNQMMEDLTVRELQDQRPPAEGTPLKEIIFHMTEAEAYAAQAIQDLREVNGDPPPQSIPQPAE